MDESKGTLQASFGIEADTAEGKKKKGFKTDAIKGERLTTGLSIDRFFTQKGEDALDSVEYKKASAQIRDTTGNVVFEMKDIDVPSGWSQLASDIVISKYIRKAGVPKTGHETSVRQTVNRISHTLAKEGERKGYFSATDSKIFRQELAYLLINQMGAFNSPVWFNLGLWHEHGIEGSGGNFAWDEATDKIKELKNNYERPQCSACFINSVDDDLMSIFSLVKTEARLFKYGSGTGTNFSRIRGHQEHLSGGGTSSGLMSFLEVFDRGAGATKSGGTTRRAAKMVCLDMDHPEIEDFITWKKREERKVAALIAAGYSSDFNGDAYRTVGGQNSNNSVRVSDKFMQAVDKDADWKTTGRTSNETVKEYKARDLWHMIGDAAWACADPGVQYDSTINRWHTCKETDRINASNPCSEYMFLDDTACNLASLNLVKFLRKDGTFDVEAYRQAIRVFILAQEILVDLSSYPTQKIARNSHEYRPLGLGYANLGTLLMLKGIPYDSEEGRAWAGALTAIMCGHAYAVSAETAAEMGPFKGHFKNDKSMRDVISMHRDASLQIDDEKAPKYLVGAAQEDWDRALEVGSQHGYRNAQVTVLAPTGTIGLLMDCDTTGIEPDFALVKFKKLAGGGYFKIVNQSVPLALRNLGYQQEQIEDILRYVLGSMDFEDTPVVNREFLKSKGLKDDEVDQIESQLPSTFELSSAFTRYSLDEQTFERLGVTKKQYESPTFNLLRHWGLKESEIRQANVAICGTMTVEGAPHIKDEHLPVFDCANKCGETGKRFIQPMGHVRMMAATQPFLSGAISKTVNVPNETTVEEIKDIYYEGWKLGLKALAVYRDGCKLSQPLSTKSDSSESEDKDAGKEEEKAAVVEAREAVDAQQNVAIAEGLAAQAEQMKRPEPSRNKLPSKRSGFTQEATIAGHKVYLRTGEYKDGSLGEIFVDMHKEGAAYRSIMNCFAIAVSMGLQYGVPLREFVNKFTFTRFEPSGMVGGHPNIKMSTSVVDFIFRVLGMEYLGRTDFVQVQPNPEEVGPNRKPFSHTPVTSADIVEKTQEILDLSVGKDLSGAEMGQTTTASPAEVIAKGEPMPGVDQQGELDLKDDHLATMMGDAPPCDQCGHTTVRNGACYRCMNCGNSMGCS